MSTITEAQYVRALHAQIRDTAALLVEPARRLVLWDDGSSSHHESPGLLAQLAGERIPSNSRHNDRGAGTGAPVAIDVLDLHQTIRIEAAAWCWRLTEQAPPAEIPDRVRALAAAGGATLEIELLRDLLRCLLDWVRAIRSVLDPPRRMELMRPCPECETTTVWRPDATTGEHVRRHALEVDGTTGADCLACGAHWPPEHLEHLALVIGCEPVTA